MVIGSDDSNRNAVKVTENISAHGVCCTVNDAPKTIDNDFRNEHVKGSFGFNTAVESCLQRVASF